MDLACRLRGNATHRTQKAGHDHKVTSLHCLIISSAHSQNIGYKFGAELPAEMTGLAVRHKPMEA